MKFKNKIYIFTFYITAIFCFAQEHNHHGCNHAHEHSGKEANRQMHQTPTDQLIKHFDSKDRDAWQKPDEVIKFLENLKEKTVYDIGAGSGYFSLRLSGKAKKVVAGDINNNFLNHIRDKINEKNISNIETRLIPEDHPGIKKNEADVVLMVNTYHHIDNRVEYLKKISDGLKSGGELVIIDFFKTELPVGPPVNHKLSMDEIIKELKEAGFSNMEINVKLLEYQFLIRIKRPLQNSVC